MPTSHAHTHNRGGVAAGIWLSWAPWAGMRQSLHVSMPVVGTRLARARPRARTCVQQPFADRRRVLRARVRRVRHLWALWAAFALLCCQPLARPGRSDKAPPTLYQHTGGTSNMPRHAHARTDERLLNVAHPIPWPMGTTFAYRRATPTPAVANCRMCSMGAGVYRPGVHGITSSAALCGDEIHRGQLRQRCIVTLRCTLALPPACVSHGHAAHVRTPWGRRPARFVCCRRI